MKPTREEILSASYFIQGSITDIERFAIAMYRKGQEDMRRFYIDQTCLGGPLSIKEIRALPIGDSNDKT